LAGSVVFLEKFPATPQEIDTALIENNCSTFFAPPIIYEMMAQYLEAKSNCSSMKCLKVAVSAGAPLKRKVSEWLRDNGVNVHSFFGSTENGLTMSSDMSPESQNWYSFKPILKDPNGLHYYLFETDDDAEPDIKHAYVRADCPTFGTGISNRADVGFDTNDFFKEILDYLGYHDYVGRRDDTLIVENGEKTNPVPMESTIRQANIVKQVAVIGRGRQCTAALVEVDMNYAIQLRPKDIVSAVQDAVNEANKDCPSHSTILPQMIEFCLLIKPCHLLIKVLLYVKELKSCIKVKSKNSTKIFWKVLRVKCPRKMMLLQIGLLKISVTFLLNLPLKF
jgi:acyl-coenzyme A synthetase/AMP-(fatty) acid ligase